MTEEKASVKGLWLENTWYIHNRWLVCLKYNSKEKENRKWEQERQYAKTRELLEDAWVLSMMVNHPREFRRNFPCILKGLSSCYVEEETWERSSTDKNRNLRFCKAKKEKIAWSGMMVLWWGKTVRFWIHLEGTACKIPGPGWICRLAEEQCKCPGTAPWANKQGHSWANPAPLAGGVLIGRCDQSGWATQWYLSHELNFCHNSGWRITQY